MKKRIFILLTTTSFLACTAYKLAEPTDADVEKAKTKFSDINLQQLQDGKKLYENNCNLCHKLYQPAAINEEQWRKIVPVMVKKVNKKTGQNTLTSKDEDKILKYLLVIRERK